jgi:D-cysteine desulfhydrase
MKTPRLPLAHLPTPLERHPRLAEALGCDLWVKRDDATGGAEAGNKIRKLELLVADARAKGADTLVTCGGLQSNHARATALVAARIGMRAVLLLRTTDPVDETQARIAARPDGNVLLDRMAGAEIRLITPAEYRERGERMADVARELEAGGARPYVIPEGGSNGLGSIGYARAMREVRAQLDLGLGDAEPLAPGRSGRSFDVVVHACGSGGTAAGVVLGAARWEVAEEVRAIAVCDDAATFQARIAAIVDECRALEPELGRASRLVVDDASKGPAYGVATDRQKALIAEVARSSGLVLDPVYTGKAFAALAAACERGELRGRRVLFLHTGGLPGLLAQGEAMAGSLGPDAPG